MKRTRTALIAATLAGSLSALLILPASAGQTDQARTTDRFEAVAAAAASLPPQHSPASGTFDNRAQTDCVSDPTGDVIAGGQDPRADIVGYCVRANGNGTTTFTERNAQPTNPDTDANWDFQGTGVIWGVSRTPDSDDDDFAVIYLGPAYGTGVLNTRTNQVVCDLPASYVDSTYSATVPDACLNGGPPFRVRAAMLYQTSSTDYGDVTSFADFPQSGSTPPPPPPPAPTGTRTVERIAGNDRYDTAVGISQQRYPSGRSAAVVFLARGDVFSPDALVGGSLTEGPTLLVPQCGALPNLVIAEIRRLNPARIVGLGGPGAICTRFLPQRRTPEGS